MNINPFDILKNVQKLQEQMGVIQEKLSEAMTTGSAGGGMVEIDMNGKMEVLDVRIEEELIAPGNRQMIQDLVGAAANDAIGKIREQLNTELGSVAGGLGGSMPPLSNLFGGQG